MAIIYINANKIISIRPNYASRNWLNALFRVIQLVYGRHGILIKSVQLKLWHLKLFPV